MLKQSKTVKTLISLNLEGSLELKEKAENEYDGEDDYYGNEQAMPSDQGVVNLANFLANAINLEDLNIRRCKPKPKQEQQMTLGAATALTG